jgi:hypothetical protein
MSAIFAVFIILLGLTGIGAWYCGRKSWTDFKAGHTLSGILGALSALGALGVLALAGVFYFASLHGM